MSIGTHLRNYSHEAPHDATAPGGDPDAGGPGPDTSRSGQGGPHASSILRPHRRRALAAALTLAVARRAGRRPSSCSTRPGTTRRSPPSTPSPRRPGITLKIFSASDAELFERLRAEGDRTPADLLFTVDAGNLWNAARAGLLAPIDSRELATNIPANLRDPQGAGSR